MKPLVQLVVATREISASIVALQPSRRLQCGLSYCVHVSVDPTGEGRASEGADPRRRQGAVQCLQEVVESVVVRGKFRLVCERSICAVQG